MTKEGKKKRGWEKKQRLKERSEREKWNSSRQICK